MFLLAHFKATLYLNIANLLAHDNLTTSYYGQVNSLWLKSSVALKGASKLIWGYQLFGIVFL